MKNKIHIFKSGGKWNVSIEDEYHTDVTDFIYFKTACIYAAAYYNITQKAE